jgi:hypothetical protein
MEFDTGKLTEFYGKLNGAIFSNTKHKRFILWRTWNLSDPYIMFIGLNPSTADETRDDPTISRLMAIAKSWNYGGIIVMNLVAYVSTDPHKIPKNLTYDIEDLYLENFKGIPESVVVMWGNNGSRFPQRVEKIHDMFPKVYCFKQNLNGHPIHPLYLSREEWYTKTFEWHKI